MSLFVCSKQNRYIISFVWRFFMFLWIQWMIQDMSDVLNFVKEILICLCSSFKLKKKHSEKDTKKWENKRLWIFSPPWIISSQFSGGLHQVILAYFVLAGTVITYPYLLGVVLSMRSSGKFLSWGKICQVSNLVWLKLGITWFFVVIFFFTNT